MKKYEVSLVFTYTVRAEDEEDALYNAQELHYLCTPSDFDEVTIEELE